MATTSKKGSVIGTVVMAAVVLAAVYAAGLFDPSKKKEPKDDEVKVSVHASQTIANRGDKNVIVVVVINDKSLPPFYPMEERWDMPLVVKKGSSIGVGVWQFTSGVVSCAIRRDGRAVATDISKKTIPRTATITWADAIEQAAKCYYLAA